MQTFDKIVIGAGLYGLYSALRCGERGQRVLVLECDPEPFMRASYINQARVHILSELRLLQSDGIRPGLCDCVPFQLDERGGVQTFLRFGGNPLRCARPGAVFSGRHLRRSLPHEGIRF